MAATAGHKDVVQLFLDKGADPNKADMSGFTPLHRSALEGHTYVVQLLLEQGAEPNRKTVITQSTPLHWAALMGHLDVVKLLLDGGANRSMTDNKGKTSIQYAVREGYSEVIQLLS